MVYGRAFMLKSSDSTLAFRRKEFGIVRARPFFPYLLLLTVLLFSKSTLRNNLTFFFPCGRYGCYGYVGRVSGG